MIERRHLPSTAALSALDALARFGSVTAAAEELSLTQGAVSRQLQALETQLGATLFTRRAKRVELTPAGERYAAEVARALSRLRSAALRLQTNPEGGTLNLAILPTFGMHWLVPRLPRFARAHPDVTVNMNTRVGAIDWSSEDFDAALRFGAAPETGLGSLKIADERMVPLASDAFLSQHGPLTPCALSKLPLLHIQSRPEAWSEWFAAHGVEVGSLPGTRHDQFTTILQAARHGLGVALVPEYLAREEQAEGRLAAACGAPCPSRGAYRLVWPEALGAAPALRAFRSWLEDEISGEDLLPR